MSLTGKQLIGGNFSATGPTTFFAKNPATGKQLECAFHEGTSEDVDGAAKLSEECFDAYRNTPPQKRSDFLVSIANEIMALGDDLIQRARAETGLPEARLVGERGRTVNQMKLFAEVVLEGSYVDARIDQGNPDRAPLPKPDVRSMKIPLGPTAIFGASNFPLAFSVAGGDTASALASGCPVIVKGHPAHPGTSEMVGSAIQQAAAKCGMPAGVFALIQGSGVTVGTALAKHPLIKAIGFTGSLQGGKALYDIAAVRPEPIPVYAEMGSTNPVFILPQALQNEAAALAKAYVDSATLGVGQFCTNPGLLLGLRSAEFDGFIQEASAHLSQKPAGVMLHAGIKSAFESGIEKLTSQSAIEKINSGDAGSGECEAAAVLLKTSAANFINNRHLEEEVFGPSSLVIECETKEDMLNIARNLTGHLTATVHGSEAELLENQELIQILEKKVGRVLFNGFPTGVEVCHAMFHGGPYPATTDSRTTSVGTAAIQRFLRPVSYQNFPQKMLPAALQNENTINIWRMVDGQMTRDSI